MTPELMNDNKRKPESTCKDNKRKVMMFSNGNQRECIFTQDGDFYEGTCGVDKLNPSKNKGIKIFSNDDFNEGLLLPGILLPDILLPGILLPGKKTFPNAEIYEGNFEKK